MRLATLTLISGLSVLGIAGHAQAIDIVLDYTYDTNNFFDTQTKRDTLEAAAAVFEVFTDSLDAIEPGTVYNQGTAFEFSDTWTASITHPGTGSNHNIVDMDIPADTLIVYAGGRNLAGSTLGIGGPGGFNVSGIASFVDTVSTRGEAGADAVPETDFAPWGGSITFDMPNDWHYDHNTAPGSNETDFFSVAVHELGHLMGFGTADSFQALISGASFQGAAATALHGSNPPLYVSDLAHWQTGTMSDVPDGGPQETAMDPDITDGQVKLFTLLDFAAMDDLGWDVPPMSAGGLEGDLNNDGFVGLDDLDIVLGAWNQTVPPADSAADPTGDGYVGLDDLDIVLGNWNAGTPPAGGVVVPEPMTASLFGLALLGILRRR